MTPELGEGRVGAFGSEDWIFFPEKSSVLHNIYIYVTGQMCQQRHQTLEYQIACQNGERAG